MELPETADRLQRIISVVPASGRLRGGIDRPVGQLGTYHAIALAAVPHKHVHVIDWLYLRRSRMHGKSHAYGDQRSDADFHFHGVLSVRLGGYLDVGAAARLVIRGADFETEFVAARFVERAGELRSLPDFDVVQIPYARRVLRGCELEGYGQVFPCRDIVYGGIARRPLSKDRGERFLGDGRVGVLFFAGNYYQRQSQQHQ